MSMMTLLQFLPVAVAGYLLGSLPSGVIYARIFGWPDPRRHGSGHTGGLNSYRGGGIPAFLLVALTDLGKGMLAVWLAGQLSDHVWALPVGGIMAVIGHNWPVWLNFSGGMGLATAGGTLVFHAWPVIVIVGVIWLLLKLLIKHSARATIFAMLTVPVVLLLLKTDWPVSILVCGMAALIALRTAGDWNRVYEKKEEA